MPTFKPNYERKIISVPSSATTLDKKHKEFLQEFRIDDAEYIPRLQKQKQEISKRLSMLESELALERESKDLNVVDTDGYVNKRSNQKEKEKEKEKANEKDCDNQTKENREEEEEEDEEEQEEEEDEEGEEGEEEEEANSFHPHETSMSRIAGFLVEKRDLEVQLKEVMTKLRLLKQKKKKYFLDNAQYIFDYFENKKNIDQHGTAGAATTPAAPSASSDSSSVPATSAKNRLVQSFFNLKPSRFPTALACESKNNNIYQKYLRNIDDSFSDISMFSRSANICQTCNHGEFIPMEDEGLLICNHCSNICQYLIENEKPSYKEPPKEVSFYAYRKINHFKEILAQFQGKETTQIPPIVMDNLRLQITKERIDCLTLNYQQIKQLLKKLGYNKYYEHINFIKNKLGIKPMSIPQELEETLCNLFMEIQYPYAKHCPDYRINFLHYYYVLYKLLELLDEKQYLPEIPMLKDKDKLLEQDEIWKKICQELDWIFFPTV